MGKKYNTTVNIENVVVRPNTSIRKFQYNPKLTTHISHSGQLYRIQVIKAGRKYVIVDGLLRFNSLKTLGIKKVKLTVSRDSRSLFDLL